MHHTHIDQFANMESGVHAMDPRVKLVTALIFIFAVIFTPDGCFAAFGVYAFALCVVMMVSHVPVSYILIRSLTVLPFALAVSVFVPFITPGQTVREIAFGPFDMQITAEGIVRFASMNLRVIVCFFATIILVSTTRFGDLMRAAGALGLPAKIVTVMTFMYRYLFIVIDEAAHMLLARNLRNPEKHGPVALIASGGIVGALFIRSFEHAEKLYMAMLLRGYSGKPVTPTHMHVTTRDVAYSMIFLGATLLGFFIMKGFNV